MAMSLKTANSPALYLLMLTNLALLYAFIEGLGFTSTGLNAAATSLKSVIPAGIGLVLVGLLNAQVPAELKARLVFMRWKHPLPGSRAFSQHARADGRVDLAALERQYGKLPRGPREQNALWYRLFKSVDSEPAVTQAHRAFLFCRDYACLTLLMMAILGGAAIVQVPTITGRLLFIGILAVQFLLAMSAARNHGERLVTTVLALAAARPSREGDHD
jgi:hypothetical protein